MLVGRPMLQWSMEASIIYRVHNQTARYQSKEKKLIGTSRHREQKIMKKIYGMDITETSEINLELNT